MLKAILSIVFIALSAQSYGAFATTYIELRPGSSPFYLNAGDNVAVTCVGNTYLSLTICDCRDTSREFYGQIFGSNDVDANNLCKKLNINSSPYRCYNSQKETLKCECRNSKNIKFGETFGRDWNSLFKQCEEMNANARPDNCG